MSTQTVSEAAYRNWSDIIAVIEYIGGDLFMKLELMLDQEEAGTAIDFWFGHDPDQALEFWENELLESAWRMTGWI